MKIASCSAAVDFTHARQPCLIAPLAPSTTAHPRRRSLRLDRCPMLRPEAFTAEKLDAQLDDGMKRFLAD
jgi:hypothetical protein